MSEAVIITPEVLLRHSETQYNLNVSLVRVNDATYKTSVYVSHDWKVGSYQWVMSVTDNAGNVTSESAYSKEIVLVIAAKINNESYFTIQSAIDSAVANDLVNVQIGTWVGAGNVGIEWPTVEHITLAGVSSADSILDAEKTTRHIYVGQGVAFGLADLTMINGRVSDNYVSENGGSIWMHTASSVTIDSCIISGNKAYDGGAMYCGQANIINSIFANNSAYRAGVFEGVNNLIINNSVMRDNKAIYTAGVFRETDGLEVVASEIYGNSASYGGVLHNAYSNARISNSKVYDNSSSNQGIFRSAQLIIDNSDIYNNDTKSAVFHYVDATVINSRIYNNSAVLGAGVEPSIFVEGIIRLINSLVYGNDAHLFGQSNSPEVLIQNSTIESDTLVIVNLSTGNANVTVNNSIFVGVFNLGLDADYSAFVVSNSIFTDTTLPEQYWEASDVITAAVAENLFEDYTVNDYRLRATSDAVNKGSNLLWDINSNNELVDIAGNARIIDVAIDAGCYEFQQLTYLAPYFNLYDIKTESIHYMTQQEVGVRIISDDLATNWYLSESSATPAADALGWVVEKPTTYRFVDDVNDLKVVYMWVKDSFNKVVKVSGNTSAIGVTLDTVNPYIENILFEGKPFVNSNGSVNITINFSENLVVSPQIELRIENTSVYLDATFVKIIEKQYVTEILITAGVSDGAYVVYSRATDNALNVGTENRSISSIILDRVANQPENFSLFDLDDYSSVEADDRVVGVSVDSDVDHIAWVLGEGITYASKPLLTSNLWSVDAPVEYMFKNNEAGVKRVYMWVKDEAYNVSDIPVVATIDYKPKGFATRDYVIVYLPSEYIAAGELRITIDFDDISIETPNVWVLLSDNTVLTIDFHDVVVTDGATIFVATMNIPTDNSYDGICHFELEATKSTGLHVDYTGTAYVGIAGYRDFEIDTYIESPVSFNLKDKDELGDDVAFTNDYIVNVTMKINEDHVRWLIDQDQTEKPLPVDQRWDDVQPYEYSFSDVIRGNKAIYLWAMDRAGNICEIPASKSILYIPERQDKPYVSVYPERVYMSVGIYDVTVNVLEEECSTPDIWLYLEPSGERITLDIVGATFDAVEGMLYRTKIFITNTSDIDGNAHFEVVVTNSSSSNIRFVSNDYINMGGEIDVVIDTKITPSRYVLYDGETLREDYTNDIAPNARVSVNPDAIAWFLSEIADRQPLVNDSLWEDAIPERYEFKSVLEGVKTVYLWVKDRADNISTTSVVASINYDIVVPTISFYERWHRQVSNNYLVTLSVSEAIDNTPNVVYSINDGELVGVITFNSNDGIVWSGAVSVNDVFVTSVDWTVSVTDNAGNEQLDIDYHVDFSDRWPDKSGVATIDIETVYLKPGNYRATLDVDVEYALLITPSVWAHHVLDNTNTSITIDNVFLDAAGVHYGFDVFVPAESGLDGQVNVSVVLTSDSDFVLEITSDIDVANYLYNGQLFYDGHISTPSFYLYDRLTGIAGNVRGLEPYLYISEDADVIGWYLSEQSSTPSLLDAAWKVNKPAVYIFENDFQQQKTIFLWIKDIADNLVGTSANVIYDATKPEIAKIEITDEAATRELTSIEETYFLKVGTYNITFNMNEELLVTPEIVILHNGIVVTDLSNSLVKASLSEYRANYIVTSGTEEGLCVIEYTITDSAGNETISATHREEFVIDVTSPLATMDIIDIDSRSIIYTNSRNVELIITVSEPVSYLVTEDVVIVDELKMFSADIPADYYIGDAGLGNHDLYLWLSDRAGNISSIDSQILLDDLAPTATVVFASIPSWVNLGDYVLTLNIGAIGSGLASIPSLYFVPENRDAQVLTVDMISAGIFNSTLNITTFTGDGNGYFTFTATDNAGNIATEVNVTIIGGSPSVITDSIYISTDIVLPVLEVYDIDSLSTTNINDQTLGVRIYNDVRATSWLIKEDSRTPQVDDVLWDSNRMTNFDLRSKINGQRNLYLWVKDDLGRIATDSIVATFSFDNVKPEIASIEITDEAATRELTSIEETYFLKVGTYNITFNMNEELLVTPALVILYNGTVVSDLSNSLVKASAAEYRASYRVTSGTTEGLYEIEYTVTDSAGNRTISATHREEFVVDVTSPLATMDVIDIDSRSILYTNSRNVELGITSSEIVNYSVTEAVVTVVDSIEFGSVIPASYYIGDAGLGVKDLYLWVSDRAGNVTSADSQIILDDLVPTAAMIFCITLDAVDLGNYNLTLNIGAIGSGLATNPVLYFTAEDKGAITLSIQYVADGVYISTLDVTTYTGDGTGYFTFTATDNAGNVAVDSAVSLLGGNPLVLTDSIYISTTVVAPSFNVYDIDLGVSSNSANDRKLKVAISGDEQAVAWMVTEVYSSTPAVENSLWANEQPAEYRLLNNDNGIKTIYLWIMNKNGLINETPSIVTLNYDSVDPSIYNLTVSRIGVTSNELVDVYTGTNAYYLRASTYNVLLEVSEELLITPSIQIKTVDYANVTSSFLALAKVGPTRYIAEYIVTKGVTNDIYNLYYSVADKAGNEVNHAMLAARMFAVDTTINSPEVLLYDKDNNDELRTDDLMVGVAITNDSDVVSWLLSETEQYSVQPSINDALWVDVSPYDYRLNNLQTGLRSVHLWTMDRAGNINIEHRYNFIMFASSELEANTYANVYVASGDTVLPGTMELTLNIIENLTITPSLALRLANGNRVYFGLEFVSTSDYDGSFYSSSINVPEIASWSGMAYFELIATRSDYTVFKATDNSVIMSLIGGNPRVNVAIPLYRLITYDQKTTNLEVGINDEVVVSFNFGCETAALAMEKIKITLSGNVFDRDVESIYLAQYADGDYESLTDAGELENGSVILNFYNSDIYFKGNKDIVLMMSIADNAIIDSRFQVVINTADIIIETDQRISANNFPYQSEPITIVRKTNKVLSNKLSPPTLNMRLGQKNVVLFDLSLRVIEGESFLSGLTLKKSAGIPDETITNLRLYRKNEVTDSYRVLLDELMVEDLSFVGGYLHINFSPFYELSEVERLFYIMADIDYVEGGARTFNVSISSTSSFRVDSRSRLLPNNIESLSNTFNVAEYIPVVLLSTNIVIDDALFENTLQNKVVALDLRTDYEVTTINALTVNVDYAGAGIGNLSIGVMDEGDVIFVQQSLVDGENRLVFNNQHQTTTEDKTLFVFIDVASYVEGTVRVELFDECLDVSSNLQSVVTFDSGTINIRSANHPHKVRLNSAKDYVNNAVSMDLVLRKLITDTDISVFYKISEVNSQLIVPWTEVEYLPSTTIDAELMNVLVDQLPLTHDYDYKFELKGVNYVGQASYESDVFDWDAKTDFTKPQFVAKKVEVSQIKHNGQIKHSLYWGLVTDDVSNVEEISVYYRTGTEPEWTIAKVVSGDKQRDEVLGLEDERTYFYKVVARNAAGLYSEALSSDGGTSTGFSGEKLSRLSNYPNPFNSNNDDTTIYYYLNQNKNLTIKIYNIFGKKMYERNCFAGELGGKAGANELIWNGTDQSGNKMPMGSYPMVVYDAETKELLDQRVIGIIH